MRLERKYIDEIEIGHLLSLSFTLETIKGANVSLETV